MTRTQKNLHVGPTFGGVETESGGREGEERCDEPGLRRDPGRTTERETRPDSVTKDGTTDTTHSTEPQTGPSGKGSIAGMSPSVG